jgi:hypothetical protein
LDATIIYLKDGKDGKIEVSMELIGDPSQSFLVGNAIVNNLYMLENTVFVNNEFTQQPPTSRVQ